MARAKATTTASTAAYIESMLVELRSMSERIDEQFLSYLIEMAMMEANHIANRPLHSANGEGFHRSTNEIQKLYMNDEL